MHERATLAPAHVPSMLWTPGLAKAKTFRYVVQVAFAPGDKKGSRRMLIVLSAVANRRFSVPARTQQSL